MEETQRAWKDYFFQSWQLKSRNVTSSWSRTNVHRQVQFISQAWKAKENRQRIPLQEGGSSWKYLGRAEGHKAA